MKKILSILLCSFILLSCTDFLDQNAEDINTLEKVFSNKNDAEKWFARLYSTASDKTDIGGYFMNELEQCQYNHPWLFATDDAVTFLDWHLKKWYQGTISPASFSTGLDGYDVDPFTRNYQGIRHASIFLENIDRCTELTDHQRNTWTAEAKFMRAMYHFWALRCNGPIPIVESSKTMAEAGMPCARNSMDECVDWISQRFLDASQELLETRTVGEMGLPTRIAALAMNSRLLLMAASPLYNGNTTYANWKNKDGKQLINQTYDSEKWKKAADAAMACINKANDLGYKLKTVSQEDFDKAQTGEERFDLYVQNYRSITTEWNDELLWARPQNAYFYCMNSLPGVFNSWFGGNGVSLDLVNSYFMADGSDAKPVDEWFSDKQFSTENGNGTIANTFWMFCNREPRFYASVHFPNMEVGYPADADPDKKEILGFWAAGNSGFNKNDGNMNYTGFSIRKHLPLSLQSDRALNIIKWEHPNPFPVIRLAEVYLNYCEAANEYYGPTKHTDVLYYLNQIRERAGIPGYSTSSTYTKDEMREMIHHERRIELAWETNRFFDVRRWFQAHGSQGLFNSPVYGLNYTKGENATDPEFFEKRKHQDRTFRIEHYFYPISASECAFNTELIQAPFY